jgi:fructose 1,6-bisphosphatase
VADLPGRDRGGPDRRPLRGRPDLLVDAPSGNVRGAGPAVAEIEFDRDPASKERPAEAFCVFAGDKCSPGAYSYPLYSVFCDPMHNGGLLLSPLHGSRSPSST